MTGWSNSLTIMTFLLAITGALLSSPMSTVAAGEGRNMPSATFTQDRKDWSTAVSLFLHSLMCKTGSSFLNFVKCAVGNGWSNVRKIKIDSKPKPSRYYVWFFLHQIVQIFVVLRNFQFIMWMVRLLRSYKSLFPLPRSEKSYRFQIEKCKRKTNFQASQD